MTIKELFIQAAPMLLKGAVITLKLTAVTLPIAVLLGLISCLLGMTKHFRFISNIYIAIIYISVLPNFSE